MKRRNYAQGSQDFSTTYMIVSSYYTSTTATCMNIPITSKAQTYISWTKDRLWFNALYIFYLYWLFLYLKRVSPV